MVFLVQRMGSPMTTVLTESTLLWTTLVVEMVFYANQQVSTSAMPSLLMQSLNCWAVYSRVRMLPSLTIFQQSISDPFSSILWARARQSPCGLSYFNCSLYSSSWMSEMLGYTKKGLRLNPLSKNRFFSFSRLMGLSYLRQVAKLVFFLILDYFISLHLASSLGLGFSFPFFSSLCFFFTFSLMVPRSQTCFWLALPWMTGLGVLKLDLVRLLEVQLRILSLSWDCGVRGIEESRCIDELNVIQVTQNLNHPVITNAPPIQIPRYCIQLPTIASKYHLLRSNTTISKWSLLANHSRIYKGWLSSRQLLMGVQQTQLGLVVVS